MLPIDGYEHLLEFSDVEHIRAAIRPRVLVPMHYRIPALEQNAARDMMLGDIDPWLDGHDGRPAQTGVRRLGHHRIDVSAGSLPTEPEIWVFDHSPAVQR